MQNQKPKYNIVHGKDSTLIYSLNEKAKDRFGDPVLTNSVMIRVEKSHHSSEDTRAIAESIFGFLNGEL